MRVLIKFNWFNPKGCSVDILNNESKTPFDLSIDPRSKSLLDHKGIQLIKFILIFFSFKWILFFFKKANKEKLDRLNSEYLDDENDSDWKLVLLFLFLYHFYVYE